MTPTNQGSKGQFIQQSGITGQNQDGQFFHSNSYHAVSPQPPSPLRSRSCHWSPAVSPQPFPEWPLYTRPDHHAALRFSGKTVDHAAVKSLRPSSSLRRPAHDSDFEGISNTKWQFSTKSAPTSILSSPVTSPHRLSSVDLFDPSNNFCQDFNDIMRMPAKTALTPDLSPRRSLGNHSPNYHHTIQDFPQDFNDMLRLPAKTTRSPDLSPRLGNHNPNYRHTIQDFKDVSRLPAKTTRSPDLSPRRSLGNRSPNYRHTIQDFNDMSRLPAKTTRSPDLSPRRSLGNHSPNHHHTSQGGSHSHRFQYCIRVGNENNYVDGYPLPLPPRASPPPQQSPAQHQTNVTLHHSTGNFHSMKGQWQKGKLIGRGSLTSVYMATNIETGTSCAMKEVDLFPDDPKFADCIKQRHQVGDQLRIYMEYVQLGSLNKFMHEHSGAMTESVVRNFTRHILSGLAYLHSTKTIHREIKCANLLVDASGIVKLAEVPTGWLQRYFFTPIAYRLLDG
ncbi:hypothetical protein TSUD_316720 [Trifolium subterraneum]|uniref:Protein kinase domain-containing protein n=1 Tax=Trifolium subterraneum TaxID=3900 RepID=A0A2Z6N242_TRISU|nr:hypothetical protein TSUD_316720 [Trifolium subterraneum]